MPANLVDLLDWYDQAGITVDDPTIMKSAFVEFRGGIVSFGGAFKPNTVPWPAGLKDCRLEWTRPDEE